MKSLACLLVVANIQGTPARAEPAPAACSQFAPVKKGHPMYWERQLSRASCLADSTIFLVESPFDVGPMYSDMSFALRPAMEIWLAAIEEGPPIVRLRTAYHVGLAAVAIMTRARSSLVAPAGMTALEAPHRERVLRARLEPLLVPAKKVAVSAFSVIDDVARENPEFEHDPVQRAMVRSSRMMLRALQPTEPAKPFGGTTLVRATP
jgi:hypothetical protein